MTGGLFLVLLLILGAEFVNGWTDAPNSIATVIGTRTLRPWQAIALASVMNLVGALSGTAVAATIGKGIIDPALVDLSTVGGAMVGIILWSSLAAWWGIPTSESHALVAGLAGGGLAAAGPGALLWEGWSKVLLGLLYSSLLGFGIGLVLMTAIYWVFRRAEAGPLKRRFRWAEILSAAFMAYSHGSNDGQKFMGAFTLALVLGGVLPSFEIPTWVILTCALTMGLGTSIGGWKIIKTMGMRLTRLQTHQGFAAQMAAAGTIELASRAGIPLSTTHTITTSILGVGAVRSFNAIRWMVVSDLVIAWIATFPICAGIAWGVVKALKALEPALT
jgi:PiT family inorganic phosphate transporter